jgi:hypothetical protein
MENKIIPYEKSCASYEKAQYWSDKNELKPNEVTLNSHKKIWFNCNCGHEFEKMISNIIKGSWCPYCSDPPQKLCDNNNCNLCFEKSFASHEKSKFWSNKNKILPRFIFKNTHNKYYFLCDICCHTFDMELYNINLGRWCSYCNGNHKLCNDNNCKICFEKSFVSHNKAQYWSDKNKLKPRNVHKQSNKKYIFNCQCGHEFDITLGNIITGFWCPYCCKPSNKLCDNDKCTMCFEKSFASYDKAQYWDNNKNKINPRQIIKGSGNKYWFICKNGHNFVQGLNSTSNGRWCPYCVNKTEQKLYDKLSILYPNL